MSFFGDQVELSNGAISVSGFEALADFDEDGDGVIDHNDTVWNDLRVWIDANHNGISDSGELKTLNELGVVNISLDVTKEENVDTWQLELWKLNLLWLLSQMELSERLASFGSQ